MSLFKANNDGSIALGRMGDAGSGGKGASGYNETYMAYTFMEAL